MLLIVDAIVDSKTDCNCNNLDCIRFDCCVFCMFEFVLVDLSGTVVHMRV